MVINATKADMDAAPRVKEDAFSSGGDFDAQSDKVNKYWVAHLAK
ncbi:MULTISPECIES: hypothetical protein [unclassified Variovorax]|nr:MULTISPECIES: hypothetical protein [unclassified Variovorax]